MSTGVAARTSKSRVATPPAKPVDGVSKSNDERLLPGAAVTDKNVKVRSPKEHVIPVITAWEAHVSAFATDAVPIPRTSAATAKMCLIFIYWSPAELEIKLKGVRYPTCPYRSTSTAIRCPPSPEFKASICSYLSVESYRICVLFFSYRQRFAQYVTNAFPKKGKSKLLNRVQPQGAPTQKPI